MPSITITGYSAATSVPSGYDMVLGASADNDTITLTGNDTLQGGADFNVNTINASGNNTINVINASINATGGINVINGVGASNQITISGSGDNVIYGGLGSVTDNGSGNNDIYVQALGNHQVSLGSGDDVIVVRDGTSGASGHKENVVLNNFNPEHDSVAFNVGLGTGMVNNGNLSEVIAEHVSNGPEGAVLSLGGLTVTFDHISASSLNGFDFGLMSGVIIPFPLLPTDFLTHVPNLIVPNFIFASTPIIHLADMSV